VPPLWKNVLFLTVAALNAVAGVPAILAILVPSPVPEPSWLEAITYRSGAIFYLAACAGTCATMLARLNRGRFAGLPAWIGPPHAKYEATVVVGLAIPAEVGHNAEFSTSRARFLSGRALSGAGYRTALWTHGRGGYYHDGRFATLREVVDHCDAFFALADAQKADLVEFLKSL